MNTIKDNRLYDSAWDMYVDEFEDMIKSITTEKEFNDAISTGRVLIDIYSPSCGPCRAMMPDVEAVAAERTDVTVYKLDVNSFDSTILASNYGVSSLPTLLLFNNTFLEFKESGRKSKEDILKLLG